MLSDAAEGLVMILQKGVKNISHETHTKCFIFICMSISLSTNENCMYGITLPLIYIVIKITDWLCFHVQADLLTGGNILSVTDCCLQVLSGDSKEEDYEHVFKMKFQKIKLNKSNL